MSNDIILKRDTQVDILGYESGPEYYSFEQTTTLDNVMKVIFERQQLWGCKLIYEIKLNDMYGERIATVQETMIVDANDYQIEEGYTLDQIVTHNGLYPVQVEYLEHFDAEGYDENMSLEEKIKFLKKYREQMLDRME